MYVNQGDLTPYKQHQIAEPRRNTETQFFQYRAIAMGGKINDWKPVKQARLPIYVDHRGNAPHGIEACTQHDDVLFVFHACAGLPR